MAAYTRLLDIIMGSPEEVPLQYRFMNIMQFAAVLSCTVCVIANTIFEIDTDTAILCAAGGIITSGLYYLSRIKRNHEISATIAILLYSLILLPGFWFSNGGTRSGIFFYYFVISGAIVIVLRNFKRIVVFFLNLVAFISLIAIEYKFPQYIIDSKSRHGTYSDLALDSIIVMILLTVMYFSIVRHYDAEHKRVQELLEMDELSGCYNRRYLVKRLEQLIEGYQTQGDIFSVMLIDLDDFKEVNDSYGHSVGDIVISEMGDFLKSNLSDEHCAARYGGDEFIVLMPGVSLPAAASLADELREKCRDRQWGDNQLGVTLSIGVIEYQGRGKDSIIQEVDNRMYGAKVAGKDRVVY